MYNFIKGDPVLDQALELGGPIIPLFGQGSPPDFILVDSAGIVGTPPTNP